MPKVTTTRGFTLPSSHQSPHHLARSLIHSIIHSPSQSPKPPTRPATHPKHPLVQPLTQTIHSFSQLPNPSTRSSTRLTTHPNQPLILSTPSLYSFVSYTPNPKPAQSSRTPSLAQPLTQLTHSTKLTFSLVCFPVHTLGLSSFTVSLSTRPHVTVVISKSKYAIYYTNQTHSVKYTGLLNTQLRRVSVQVYHL